MCVCVFFLVSMLDVTACALYLVLGIAISRAASKGVYEPILAFSSAFHTLLFIHPWLQATSRARALELFSTYIAYRVSVRS